MLLAAGVTLRVRRGADLSSRERVTAQAQLEDAQAGDGYSPRQAGRWPSRFLRGTEVAASREACAGETLHLNAVGSTTRKREMHTRLAWRSRVFHKLGAWPPAAGPSWFSD